MPVRMSKRLSHCLLAALLWCMCAQATPFVSTQTWSNAHPDIEGRLTGQLQDSRGYIWISSFNGLTKYDGYRFIKYKSNTTRNSPLYTNRINIIRENSHGDIWCITSFRTYLFDTQKEQFLDIQPALNAAATASEATAMPEIISVFPLRNGHTWLVSRRGDCFRVDDGRPLESCELYGRSFQTWENISNVYLDPQGREWILSRTGLFRYGQTGAVSNLFFTNTYSYGDANWLVCPSRCLLGRWSGRTQQLELVYFPEEIGNIRHFHQQRDSLLLCATDCGLYEVHLRDGQMARLTDKDLKSFDLDERGLIWGVLTDGRTWCRLPDGTEKCHTLPEGYPDPDSEVWFRSDHDGLTWLIPARTNDVLYFDASQQVWLRPDGLRPADNDTKRVFEDRQGNIWYRREQELDCMSLHNTPFGRLPFGDEVRALSTDSHGRLWTCLRNRHSVCCVENGRLLGYLGTDGQLHSNDSAPFASGIYCLYEDSRHRLWLGSRNDGLWLLEPTDGTGLRYRTTHFVHDDGQAGSLSHSSVYSILEDCLGHIWIGTFGGGLNLYDNGRFVHAGNGLSTGRNMPTTIRALREPAPGVLAICAKEGFYTMDCRFDLPENIVLFHNERRPGQPNSLGDNDVMDACLASGHRLFLCTNGGGLSEVMSDDWLHDNLDFRTLTRTDGMGSDITYSCIEDSLGYLWIVNPLSLTRLSLADGTLQVSDASEFCQNPTFSEMTPLYFHGQLLFGDKDGLVSVRPERLQPSRYCPPLEITGTLPARQDRMSAGRLTLGSDERTLGIQFAAIDYQDNSNIRYAYRLNGVDKGWNETAAISVTYTNLPPGNLTFHVRSTNNDGQWMDNEQQLLIRVKPRATQTLWFFLLLALLAALVIVYGIRIYLRFYHLRHQLSVEKQLTEAKLRFFTDISHELRTPLSLVEGPVSEVLDDQQLSDQSRYYLEVVQKNVRRMLNLINQILDFRKIQNQKMVLVAEQLDVRQQLQHIMDNFRQLAEQHHIDFTLNAPDGPCTIWADRDKFEKIFFNLISNAFKYTPDHKAIRLVLHQEDGRLAIAVSDQGIGIKKESIQGLFQRFETVLDSNLFKPSSGIGLSLVKQFVDMHHADIDVQSQVGVGSTFTVRFQLGREHFQNDSRVEFYVADSHFEAEATRQEILPDNPGEAKEKPTVLLVEDNAELRDFIRHILEDRYLVLEARDGQEGLQLSREKWPDLIVTDVMMPVMDGFEMVRRIKADPDIYYIPIIVLTAKATMDDKIRGVEMGVDDYVMKPFSANYLKVRVAALLEQRHRLQQRFVEQLSRQQGVSHLNLEPDMPHITPSDELFIQEVMAFMEQNMDNAELTIDQFAEAIRMGRTVFYNKLKATLGLTPVDFVQEMRIKRAVQLMNGSGFTVAEIAYRTGFNDPKYFSRCFKKHMGMTPTEYQKSGSGEQRESGSDKQQESGSGEQRESGSANSGNSPDTETGKTSDL